MRILMLITSLLLTTSMSMQAQDISFGVKGGINFANASQNKISTNGKTAFHVGGVMEALFTDKIALQTEILYSVQGFSFVDAGVEQSLKTSSINVPAMLEYFISEGFYIEAGPQIGFLYGADLTTTTNGVSEKSDVKEGLRSNDLSINAGIGIKFKNTVSLNTRYTYGLTNITDRLSNQTFKNRVLQVSLVYFF